MLHLRQFAPIRSCILLYGIQLTKRRHETLSFSLYATEGSGASTISSVFSARALGTP